MPIAVGTGKKVMKELTDQIYSVKGQKVNLSGFAGHIVSVSTQLCHCRIKAAIDHYMQTNVTVVLIKPCLQIQTVV